ncbi:MAG: AAA family ATPase, partial [Cyanobacteria bacterium P01_A01_bin.68]
KTTTAIHLAHWLSRQGENVLLVDADSNRTSTAWQATLAKKCKVE